MIIKQIRDSAADPVSGARQFHNSGKGHGALRRIDPRNFRVARKGTEGISIAPHGVYGTTIGTDAGSVFCSTFFAMTSA